MAKPTPLILSVQQAAPFLGMDSITLMGALKAGHFKEFGEAFKTNKNNECYNYKIYKYPLFTKLGIDVNLPVEKALELVSGGCPPWIDQAEIISALKKDA